MTLPFKLRVLHGLTDALKQITPSNGFVCDMGDFVDTDGITTSRVFRGRAWFGDADRLPLISILEGSTPADTVVEPSTAETPFGEYDWDLLVQGFVDDDAANPTDPAYVLLADTRMRLAQEAARRSAGVVASPDPFGLGRTPAGSITKMTFGSGVVRPADEISARAYFWLSVRLRIIELATLPYA